VRRPLRAPSAGHRPRAVAGPERAGRPGLPRHQAGLGPGQLHYFISDPVADFLVDAVDLLATHGHRLLGDYRFDPRSGQWRHRLGPPDAVPSLADLLEGRSGPGPGPAGEDALAGYLRQARALLAAARAVTEAAGPSWLPPELERLRDFPLPGDTSR
jgi:hypothetical protein